MIKKLLTPVLVAAVLLGTIAAKAMAQEPDEGDDHKLPEHPEPSENQQGTTVGDNNLGTGGGNAPILLIAGVLVGAIVVTTVLVVAFHKAASGQSMEILEGY